MQTPLPQDATGLGILIAGIGVGASALAFAYKTFRNGSDRVAGDLEAERRTNNAVKEVLSKLDAALKEALGEIYRTRAELRNGQQLIISEVAELVRLSGNELREELKTMRLDLWRRRDRTEEG